MPEAVTHRRLWMGVLLAPGAWLLTEFVGYYLASRSCESGVRGVPLAGTMMPRAVQIVLCVAALVAALYGLLVAVNNDRAVARHPRSDAPELGRARFMSRAGIFLGILFAGGIVLFALPALFVNACSQAR